MTYKKEHIALTRCFYCNEPDRILLATRYHSDGEPVRDLAPLHNKVVDMEPCKKCADLMKQGIILLGIDSKLSEPGWEKEKLPNPWRTGAVVVVKEEAFDRIFVGDGFKKFAHKHRFMFTEHEVLEKLGMLPVAVAQEVIEGGEG